MALRCAGQGAACASRTALSTRLGTALRHAGAEIASVRSHRKLILVLTDGEPSDIDVVDPHDLVEDARRAVLALARAASTCSASRSIRPAPARARRCPQPAHAGGRLEDLPARLAELYFRLARR